MSLHLETRISIICNLKRSQTLKSYGFRTSRCLIQTLKMTWKIEILLSLQRLPAIVRRDRGQNPFLGFSQPFSEATPSSFVPCIRHRNDISFLFSFENGRETLVYKSARTDRLYKYLEASSLLGVVLARVRATRYRRGLQRSGGRRVWGKQQQQQQQQQPPLNIRGTL